MTASDRERLEILEMIQQGKVSPAEGLRLIEVLNESLEIENQEYIQAREEMLSRPPNPSAAAPDQELDPDEPGKWRQWWIIPFWSGVAITVLGGALMYWAWAARGIGLGFVAAWIPFLIGLGVMMLGWNSRTGPWIHIRVQQKPGESPERIFLSLPIPVRATAWVMRTFGRWIPYLPGGMDEVLFALKGYSPGDPPLSIKVDDEEDGQKVLIYIG